MDRQQIGSKKWRTSKWKQLLELVLPALDELSNELAGLSYCEKGTISRFMTLFSPRGLE